MKTRLVIERTVAALAVVFFISGIPIPIPVSEYASLAEVDNGTTRGLLVLTPVDPAYFHSHTFAVSKYDFESRSVMITVYGSFFLPGYLWPSRQDAVFLRSDLTPGTWKVLDGADNEEMGRFDVPERY